MRNAVDLVLSLEHLAFPIALLAALTVVGTVGYVLLLDLDVLDGLYQALTTLSTVGFEELVPFTHAAKVFTIFLIITGVGTVFYTLTLLVATVVEGDLRRNYERRRMMRRIDAMKKHFVICGYGRVGREIARGFAERGTELVVVDPDPEAVRAAEQDGFPVVSGSAADEGALVAAGIGSARALLAAANSDAVNVYIALTAKKLRPDLYVIARSEMPASEEKLRLAGVDRVVSPHALSGRRMMLTALQPLITDFVDTLAAGRHGELILAELEVHEGSVLDGLTLADGFRSAPDTTVLGVRRGDGQLVVGPRGDTRLAAGDIVIVLAAEAQIEKLHAPRPAPAPARTPSASSPR